MYRTATKGSVPEFFFDLAANAKVKCVELLNESKHSCGADDYGVVMTHLGGLASKASHFKTNVDRGLVKLRMDQFDIRVSPETHRSFPHTEERVYFFRKTEFRRDNRDGVSKLTASRIEVEAYVEAYLSDSLQLSVGVKDS